MAAGPTVSQDLSALNSTVPIEALAPRHGVVTLFGYGIRVLVQRGHLILEDGIGTPRRRARFARVGHGVRRVVVVGSDGMVSLAAARWLADQKAAFVMLDRRGTLLLATGPVGPSDARLRRAQALAHHTGVAMPISRALIDQKLAGEERVARDLLHDVAATQAIGQARVDLQHADTPFAIRQIEAQAALAYWSAWHSLHVTFPRADMSRVPEHWRTFGARRSPISNSPRLAANPPNAILNFLFALLEAETRLASVAVGLDPGLGFSHVDTDARDSLALDLMEAVRPDVEAFVLRWLISEPLHREWFYEERNGNCRLMGSFTEKLAETASTWARAVGPVVERVAATLWATIQKPKRARLPTRVTQQHPRDAQGVRKAPGPAAAVRPPHIAAPPIVIPRPPRVCRGCGVSVERADRRFCATCGRDAAAESLARVASRGRVAALTAKSQERRAGTQRRHASALRAWTEADQPAWLTETAYAERILPALGTITITTLMSALGVSKPYAINVRAGRRRPHPRHWLTLATLTGVSG